MSIKSRLELINQTIQSTNEKLTSIKTALSNLSPSGSDVSNPYTASTTSEMSAYLASKYDGAIVKYTGTSGTYTKNMLYKVKAVSSNEWTFDELLTPTGSITKTANGTYDIKEYASVVINVPTGTTPETYNNEVVNLYEITANIVNLTGDPPKYIEESGSLQFTVAPEGSDYTLPDTITVTGCSYTWNNGTVTLSNPTSDVTIEIVGVELNPITDLTGTSWIFNDTISWSSLPDTGTYQTFNINFHSMDTAYHYLELKPNNYVDYGNDNDNWVYQEGTGWDENSHKEFTVVNGNDVTNETLIKWLKANATLKYKYVQSTDTDYNPSKTYYEIKNGKYCVVMTFYESSARAGEYYERITIN